MRSPGPRPLRIAVVSETDRRDVRLDKQVRALVALGHEVHLVAPRPPDWSFGVEVVDGTVVPDEVFGMTMPDETTPDGWDGLAEEAQPGPHRVLRLLRSGRGVVRTVVTRLRRPRERRRRLADAERLVARISPDVIFLHRDALAADLLLRGRLGAPVVVDLHELPSFLHGQRFLPDAELPRKKRSAGVRLLRALRFAAAVTSEELIARHLSDEFGMRCIELPEVILGAQTEAYRSVNLEGARSFREHVGLDETSSLIVYLGFYRPNRGVERLVEAIALLPDAFHLALVVGWTGRDLRRALRDHPAADRIHLLNLVPQSRLTAALSGADLGVYVPEAPRTPHEHLCVPTKLFEFHAAGVPVLVADDEGLVEFSDRYGGTVVLDRPVDAAKLAEAIRGVVDGRSIPSARRPTPDLRLVMRDVLAVALPDRAGGSA